MLPFASFSDSKVTVTYVSGTGLLSGPSVGLSFSGFVGSAGIHGTILSVVYSIFVAFAVNVVSFLISISSGFSSFVTSTYHAGFS